MFTFYSQRDCIEPASEWCMVATWLTIKKWYSQWRASVPRVEVVKTYRYESCERAFMSNHKDPSWLLVWWTRHWEPFMNVSHLHDARKGASRDLPWIFNYSERKIAQFHCIHRRNGFQRHFSLSFHLKHHVRLSMWSFLEGKTTKKLIRAHRKLKTRNERRRKDGVEHETQTQAIKKRGPSECENAHVCDLIANIRRMQHLRTLFVCIRFEDS